MSAVLTAAAVFALAGTCQSLVAPMTILKIAQVESALDPQAVHRNRDGSTDFGLMQINSKNFALLGLTSMADALDPCRSISAAAALLASFSRYNSGSPTRSLAYAASVQAVRISDPVTVPQASAPADAPTPCPEPDPTGWHAVALVRECQSISDTWHIILHQKDLLQ